MGGGSSKTRRNDDDVNVAALVANVKRNEKNVFEIPFRVKMTKGKKGGKTVIVPCAPTESVRALKEKIAAVTGDVADDLTVSYGRGDTHEGKILFVESKGPKFFKFDEESVKIGDCRCNKSTKLACNASKDINLDAFAPENTRMLHENCERGLQKPMLQYKDAYKKVLKPLSCNDSEQFLTLGLCLS